MRRIFPLLLVAILLGAVASRPNVPRGPVILRQGWQFALDPSNEGLRLGWQNPRGPFPAGRLIETGAALEDQGVPAYKGISWFRQEVAIPSDWRRVVLGFAAIDVACDVYVNGQWLGHFEDAQLQGRAVSLDITSLTSAGSAVIVFRVVGTGGAGGIKQAVELGQDESEVMTGQQYVLFLHDRHPDWRLPSWATGGRRAWVVAGVEGASTKAIVSVDGSFSPWANAYSVTFWLYDPSRQLLVDFPPPSAHLRDGSSPMPVFLFESGPWRLQEEVAASGNPGAPSITVRLTLLGAPHFGLLYAAIRPYTASGGTAPIADVRVGNDTVLVDGHVALSCSQCGTVRGGALAEGDASAWAGRGQLPPLLSARSSDGQAQGMLRWQVKAGQSSILVAPSTQVSSAPSPADFDQASAQWQRRLSTVKLRLPDTTLQDAYYASLAYILLEEHGNQIHPGPLMHDNFWVRDAAMIGYALDRAGLAAAVRGSAESMLNAISVDGQVAAKSDSVGHVLSRDELDAPGEAAFGLAEYARFSHDRAFLERAYPAMADALRRAMADRDVAGLVPPNHSAEDLGPSSIHHYWDDFWLLTGLREAGWAASQLDRSDDSQAFRQMETELREALLRSIAAAGKSFIGNGPEDTQSSAMARGTSPALWPLNVLDPSSSLVRRSFQTYYRRFIQPFGGAYRHLYGLWWPYGGLELAHDFLFLGMRTEMQQVLDYTLAHQSAPSLFAWPEGADPTTGSFAEGDMPHAWASAELVNLVRDMLLYEDGSSLVVGAGVPAGWRGKAFSASNLPTFWGRADLTVSEDGTVRISGVTPPGGILLRFPFPAKLAQSDVG